jgi:ABC-type sulfate/molybdate transport systems ATPase subunit
MLKVENIIFSYQKEATILESSFTLDKGKTLAIIGESGCGKSTLLKLIYGLYDLDKGRIFWKDIEVLGPKYHLIPGMEFMKYLAQDFDLMPFITVAENIGKYLSNIYPEAKKERISELLEIVEMQEFGDVKAKYLSGGQMQRVAIARVLALEPEVLLLDEPFSHIDNFRKNSLRRKLFTYLKNKQITCIVATHDSTDVLSFADEVMVMQKGTIIEKGSPKFIYENPKSLYVASLFGDVNAIDVQGKMHFVYPHQLIVVSHSNLKIIVTASYFRGSHYLVEAQHEKGILFFDSKTDFPVDEKLFLEIKITP